MRTRHAPSNLQVQYNKHALVHIALLWHSELIYNVVVAATTTTNDNTTTHNTNCKQG